MLEIFCPEIEILLGYVAATLGMYVNFLESSHLKFPRVEPVFSQSLCSVDILVESIHLTLTQLGGGHIHEKFRYYFYANLLQIMEKLLKNSTYPSKV